MSDFVLDASVALAWVLDKSVPVYALDVQREMLGGKRGLVPALWHLEIANGLAMAERRGDLSGADVEDALDQILTAAASKLDTETDLVSARDALANARRFQLTAYDAAYLDLARREELPLATLDKGLRAAATKAGVALLK
ncbi:MAG: VapC toxin family PIN domain ribonuclease [Acidobacteria bacterium]|nr:MAG: VapC toxin family PIN domain ribonuclease [Acidobacteriota bacterium]PYT61608.1 MAG: VapC toxin family PIN domain ribonuclease [Acidobacteriota bacterium]